MTLFIFLALLLNIPNLSGEQNALAGKVNKDMADIKLKPQEEADLIEHLEELENWELIENIDMLQNLEVLENMDSKNISTKES